MKKWFGSAAICVNDNYEVLMVRAKESDSWEVPSGSIEEGETPEECCVREVREETGYTVEVKKLLFVKTSVIEEVNVKAHYFLVEIVGESTGIEDPDEIIDEVDWKSLSEIVNHKLTYAEDEKILANIVKSQMLHG
ncbi:NUDIX hydrolase [Ornithinibacillus bavariensis]|uniref:NUDIX hydrolase n=1 Tax=Ornithinibacillus bavariensis TaxID=545502 RepID=UPI000EC53AF3|nr:DNA mismatch repair protein MutT [Ornithinibacillus sp.]